MNLRELYQEVIIDHSKNPKNFHPMADANRHANGFNRLCGDKLTLYLQVENGLIKQASFTGSGCAISTASASLMTEFLQGKTETQARIMFDNFHTLLTVENFSEPNNRDVCDIDLGKLNVLTGVREFPSRIKCATLAWHTLQAALANEKEAVSTEE